MKDIIKWALYTGAVLGALLVGLLYNLPSLAMLAVIIYWITGIVAFLTLGVLSSEEGKKQLTAGKATLSKVPKWLDALKDICVVAVLVYFTYPVLAIFYALHIPALWAIRVVLEKANEAN